MARLLIPLVVIIIGLGVFVGLDKPAPRADLVFISRADVFTLDPQRMSYLQDFRLGDALYEGLVRWDNVNATVVPAACSSWDVSGDGLVYTFHLRTDARWSNGDPLTAHDFVYTWRRAILPDTAADFASMLFIVKGARAMLEWRGAQLRAFAAGELEMTAEALWDETVVRFASTVGVRAIDANTFEVTLEKPVTFALDLMTFGVFSPVHRPTVEGWDMGESMRMRLMADGWREDDCPPLSQCAYVSLDSASARLQQKHAWTKPGKLVCNGPYVLTRWRYKRDMRLEANPFYHSPDSVKSKTVDIPSLPDANASILAFESGVIDWHTDAAVEYQADMIAQQRVYEDHHQAELVSLLAQGLSKDEALAQLPAPGVGERRDLHVLPAFGTDFYSFNCRGTLSSGAFNPFVDARVRKAFALAIDKRAIATQVTRIGEPVANVLVPRDAIPGYASPDGLEYNPEAARQMLANLGWLDRNGDGQIEADSRDGEPFPTVEILYSTNSPRYRNISLALRDMWQRELGVRIELRGLETKFFREALKRGDFMIARGGWFGDFGDPTTFLNICATESGNNDRGYHNPAFDELLARAADERDPGKRFALLADAERILIEEDFPLVPICQYALIYLYDPARVKGISTHPRLQQYLHQIEVVEP